MRIRTPMEHGKSFVPISEETRILSLLFVIAGISSGKPEGGFALLARIML